MMLQVPLKHDMETELNNGYFSPKCSCGWRGGCWGSYENARLELYKHEKFVEELVRLYSK